MEVFKLHVQLVSCMIEFCECVVYHTMALDSVIVLVITDKS